MIFLKKIFKDYFKVGKLSLEDIFQYLLNIGVIVVLLKSIALGVFISKVTTYDKTIKYMENGMQYYTSIAAQNTPLGIIVGVIVFFVSVVIWKLFIELLYKFFRYFDIKSE